MAKAFKVKVRTLDSRKAVQEIELSGGVDGAGRSGKPVHLRTAAGEQYELLEKEIDRGPVTLATKRIGNDLNIAFEGGDIAMPDLVLHDYYLNCTGAEACEVVGIGQDGMVGAYVPETGSVDAILFNLAESAQAQQVLMNAPAFVASSGAALAGFALGPILGALGLLGGAAALAGRDTTDNTDRTPPEAPVLISPSNGKTFAGTAEPGSTVEVKDRGGNVIGTATVDGNGNWSLVPATKPEDGPVTVTAKDAAGNVSPATTGLIDTSTVGISNPPDVGFDQGTPVHGTGPKGAVVTLAFPDGSLKSAVVDANGKWALNAADMPAAPLTDGMLAAVARAKGSDQILTQQSAMLSKSDYSGEITAWIPIDNDTGNPIPAEKINVGKAANGEVTYGDKKALSAGGYLLEGTSNAPAGSTIKVSLILKNGSSSETVEFTTTVGADGKWQQKPTPALEYVVVQANLDPTSGTQSTMASQIDGLSDPTGRGYRVVIKLVEGKALSAAPQALGDVLLGDGQAAPLVTSTTETIVVQNVKSVRIDAISSDTGDSNTDFLTNVATQKISGVAFAEYKVVNGVYVPATEGTFAPIGTKLFISVGDGTLRTVQVKLQGKWELDYTGVPLADGSHQIKVHTFGFDQSRIEAPIKTVVIDTGAAIQFDAGLVGGDNIINGAEKTAGVTITGKADNVEAGRTVTVEITDGTKTISKTATTGSNGEWSIPLGSGELDGFKQGELDLKASVTDKAGNAVNSTAKITLASEVLQVTTRITEIVDDLAPGLGKVDDKGFTNDTTPLVKGDVSIALKVGEAIVVYRTDGSGKTEKLGAATVAGTTWSYGDSGLSNGAAYTYSARVESGDQTGDFSNRYQINIDTDKPTQKVTIDTINDNVDPVQGVVANKGSTNDTTPELKGAVDVALATNESVEIFRSLNGQAPVSVGTATVDAGRKNWNFTDAGLKDGDKAVYTARVIDAAKNEGAFSAAYEIAIDTVKPTQNVTIDTVNDNVDPVQGVVANKGSTNDTTPELKGAVDVVLATNESVEIFRSLNGQAPVSVGTATVDAGRKNWNFTDAGLKDGDKAVYTARVIDAAKNEGAFSAAYEIAIDTVKPTQNVTIDTVNDNVDPVQGVVANKGSTNDTTPELKGAVDVALATNESVEIFRSLNGQTAVSVGTATVDAGRKNWNFTDAGLKDGDKAVYTARVIDAAKNEGAFSVAYEINVDRVAPALTVVITGVNDDVAPVIGVVENGGRTNDLEPEITGTVSAAPGVGEFVEIYRSIGGVEAKVGRATLDTATLKWTITDKTGLADGQSVTYSAKVVDAAGNEGAKSNIWNINISTRVINPDTEASIVAIEDDRAPGIGVIPTDGKTNDTTPLIKGKVTAALSPTEMLEVWRQEGPEGTPVRVGVAKVSGTDWSIGDSGLLDGKTYTYTAKVTNADGGEGKISAPYAIVIDTTAPQQTVAITKGIDSELPYQGVLNSGDATNDVQPAIEGTLSAVLAIDESVQIWRSLNGAAAVLVGKATVSGTAWTYAEAAALNADDVVVYSARVVDGAQNASKFSNDFSLRIETSRPSQVPMITNVIDDLAPSIGNVANGATTNDDTPTLVGQLNTPLAAGERVIVLRSDGSGVAQRVGEAQVSGTGWTYQEKDSLRNGQTYTYSAKIVNQAGIEGDTSNTWKILTSTSAPSKPLISEVLDDVGPVQEAVADKGVTDDARPEITGAGGVPNGKVAVYDGPTKLGEATVKPDGTWSFTPTQDLANGPHAITARNVSGSGVESEPSAVREFSVDTVKPTQAVTVDTVVDDVGPVQGVVARGGVTDDTEPQVKGSVDKALAADEVVQVLRTIGGKTEVIGSTTVDSALKWSVTDTRGLLDGQQVNYSARVVDKAGNQGASSTGYDIRIGTSLPVQTVTIDKITDDVAPVTGVVANGGATNDATPTLEGKLSATLAAGDVIEVLRKDVATGAVVKVGTATVSGTGWVLEDKSGTLVSGKGYEYTAQVVNPQGGKGAPSSAYRIEFDNMGPPATQKVEVKEVIDDFGKVTGTVTNGGTTDDTSPTIKGTIAQALAKNEVVEVRRSVNGGAEEKIGIASVTDLGWSIDDQKGLSDGQNVSYAAYIVDAAGNVGPASNKYAIAISTGSPTSKAEVTAISDDFGPVQGTVARGGETDDVTPKVLGTLTVALADGESVEVWRQAGSGTAVKLSGVATVSGTGWSYNDSGLENGKSYTYFAQVVNANGNAGGLGTGYQIKVSTSAPSKPLISEVLDDVGPVQGAVADKGVTDDARPEITGAGGVPNGKVAVYDGPTKLGEATVKPDGTWSFTPTQDLANGPHAITARNVSGSGVESEPSAVREFSVDTVKPTQAVTVDTVVDDVGPVQGVVARGGVTDDTEPQVKGSVDKALAADEVVQVLRTIGGKTEVIGSTTVDSALKWSVTDTRGLLDGQQVSYSARVVDKAGNQGASSTGYDIRIGTSLPAQTVTIDKITDDVAPVTGVVANGGATNDATPTLEGKLSATLAAGDVIEVLRKDVATGVVVKVGTATVSGTGWVLEDKSGTLVSGKGYEYTAQVVNPQGGKGAPSSAYRIEFDNMGPPASQLVAITDARDDVGAITGLVSVQQFKTDDTTPEVLGTITQALAMGEIVKVWRAVNGSTSLVEVGTAVLNKLEWSLVDNLGLKFGDRVSYFAAIVDAAGNQGPLSKSLDLVISEDRPVGPIKAPDLTAETDTGVSDRDDLTKNQTPGFLIDKPASGLTPNLYVDGKLVASTFDSVKNILTPKVPIAEGKDHVITYTLTNASGGESPQSPQLKIGIDITAPAKATFTAPAVSIDGLPTLTGKAEANALVKVTFPNGAIVSVQADGSGNWSAKPVSALPDVSGGSVSVTVTDAAGNTNQPTISTITVSRQGVTLTSPPSNGYSQAVPISGKAPANSLVTVTFPDGTTKTTTADAAGVWKLPAGDMPVQPVTSGNVKASASDPASQSVLGTAEGNLTRTNYTAEITAFIPPDPDADAAKPDFTQAIKVGKNDNGETTYGDKTSLVAGYYYLQGTTNAPVGSTVTVTVKTDINGKVTSTTIKAAVGANGVWTQLPKAADDFGVDVSTDIDSANGALGRLSTNVDSVLDTAGSEFGVVFTPVAKILAQSMPAADVPFADGGIMLGEAEAAPLVMSAPMLRSLPLASALLPLADAADQTIVVQNVKSINIDKISTDTGDSAIDFLTNVRTQKITGTAYAEYVVVNGSYIPAPEGRFAPIGTKLFIAVGDGVLLPVTVGLRGKWTLDYTGVSLADGSYALKVHTFNFEQQRVEASKQTLVIDTVAGNSINAGLAGDGAINITEKAAGVTVSGKVSNVEFDRPVTVKVSDGTVTVSKSVLVDQSGNWQTVLTAAELSGLRDGTLQVTAQVADRAGNTGTGSTTLKLDTAGPIDGNGIDAGTTRVIINNVTSDNVLTAPEAAVNQTLSGRVIGEYQTGDALTLVINGRSYATTVGADGSFSVTNVAGADLLADADRTINATLEARDAAGNIGRIAGLKVYAVDNAPASVSGVSTPTVTEGQAAVFDVALSKKSLSVTTVFLDAVSGTAQENVRFNGKLAGVSFDGGQSWQTLSAFEGGQSVTVPANVDSFKVRISTIDDSAFQGAQSFRLIARADGQANISGTATILDNDSRNEIRVEGSSSIWEGNQGAYRAVASHAVAQDTWVTVRVDDGSARRWDGNDPNQKIAWTGKVPLYNWWLFGYTHVGDSRPSYVGADDRFAYTSQDYTVLKSGVVQSGGGVQVLIRAGQTASEAFNVRANSEEVLYDRAYSTGMGMNNFREGTENFSLRVSGVNGGGDVIASSSTLNVLVYDNSTYTGYSPISIDLNGDGVKTLGIEHGVEFDMYNTGRQVKTGWISKEDGLLAVDRNGDGLVNDRSELFGGAVGDGFAKLATYDANGDGVVNAGDKHFGDLRVWVDGNSNGITEAGELRSLEEMGIKVIRLDNEMRVEWQNGNILGERGSVVRSDGSEADMVDVYFRTEVEASSDGVAMGLDDLRAAMLQSVGFVHPAVNADGVAAITMGANDGDSVTLTVEDVLLAGTQNLLPGDGKVQLAVTGDSGQAVRLPFAADGEHSGWIPTGTTVINGQAYMVFDSHSSQQQAELLIQQNLQVIMV